MNWSSMGMLAVISRVDEEILMLRGGSDVAWEGAHSLTALSSDAIILGDIWEVSLVMESWTWGNRFSMIWSGKEVTNIFLGPSFYCNDFLAGGGVPPPHF